MRVGFWCSCKLDALREPVVLRLRQLDDSLSRRKTWSLLRPGYEGSTVHEVAIGTFCSPSTSVFPCQYHSTIAPYSFIHLPPMLYNVFLPVLQFSPVSNIPSMPHSHLHIYLARRTNWRGLGTFEKAMLCPKLDIRIEKYFRFFLRCRFHLILRRCGTPMVPYLFVSSD